jgi:hypothetical protein
MGRVFYEVEKKSGDDLISYLQSPATQTTCIFSQKKIAGANKKRLVDSLKIYYLDGTIQETKRAALASLLLHVPLVKISPASKDRLQTASSSIFTLI